MYKATFRSGFFYVANVCYRRNNLKNHLIVRQKSSVRMVGWDPNEKWGGWGNGGVCVSSAYIRQQKYKKLTLNGY